MYKICPKCGRRFKAKPRQKYDSPKCRKNDYGARRRYYSSFGILAQDCYELRVLKRAVSQFKKEL